MHTNAVIDCLVRRARPIPVRAVERRIGAQAAVGGGISLVLLMMSFGVRTDLASAVGTAAFWVKAGYVSAILLISLALLSDFARPEANPTRQMAFFLAPVLALAAGAGFELASSPQSGWRALLMGMTAGKCSVRIAFFALPALIALFAAFRNFAPTRLAPAGATIGAAAGAIGAFVYMLYCREIAAGFVLVWYTLGIASMAALGALIGPAALKWK